MKKESKNNLEVVIAIVKDESETLPISFIRDEKNNFKMVCSCGKRECPHREETLNQLKKILEQFFSDKKRSSFSESKEQKELKDTTTADKKNKEEEELTSSSIYAINSFIEFLFWKGINNRTNLFNSTEWKNILETVATLSNPYLDIIVNSLYRQIQFQNIFHIYSAIIKLLYFSKALKERKSKSYFVNEKELMELGYEIGLTPWGEVSRSSFFYDIEDGSIFIEYTTTLKNRIEEMDNLFPRHILAQLLKINELWNYKYCNFLQYKIYGLLDTKKIEQLLDHITLNRNKPFNFKDPVPQIFPSLDFSFFLTKKLKLEENNIILITNEGEEVFVDTTIYPEATLKLFQLYKLNKVIGVGGINTWYPTTYRLRPLSCIIKTKNRLELLYLN